VVSRGREYTLPEIGAFVLKRAREVAETALGERVDRAVITVPAHFNELQRAATKVAGRVAGLEVLRILNEPTAAALAYGLGKGAKERIAIYDFGGGTFDATLLDLNGNVFEVLATAGDAFLGGDDIDDLIADRMSDAFLVQHRFDPRTDGQTLERLRQAAEQVKINLTTQEQTQLHIREVAFGVGGSHLDLVFGLSRSELEKMAEPLVERTFKVTQDALALARLAPSEFDKTILVGGTSRMQLVRRRVEAFFGAPPMDRMNPDEVVAIGAAIQAAALTDASRRRSIPPPPPTAFSTPRKSAPSFNDLVPQSSRAPSSSDFSVDDAADTQAMRRDSVPSSSRSPDSSPKTKRGTGIPPAPSSSSLASASAPRVPTTTARMTPPPPPMRPRMPSQRDLPSLKSTSPGQGPVTSRSPSRPDIPGSTPFGTIEEPASFVGSAPGAAPPVSVAAVISLSAPLPPPPATPRQPVALAPPPVAAVAPAPPAPSAAPATPKYMSQPPRAPVFTASMPPPVLIDVTPRALVVETAGGYCDTVIPRNAKIPCERTRVFATAQDGQLLVRVRVAQGEDTAFRANTYLGEVELGGIRAAPRGEVSVAVTFELDADGSLRVRAADQLTGRQATAQLRLTGIAAEEEITAMRDRMEQSGAILGG
jgi:molecular chaperone DnaK